jgi:hypothetical protein
MPCLETDVKNHFVRFAVYHARQIVSEVSPHSTIAYRSPAMDIGQYGTKH